MFHMLWKWRIYNVMKMNGWIQDSPREGAPTFREGTSIRFCQNFQKLHENENILGRRGWGALPDPPMRWNEANAVEIMNILVLIKHCACHPTCKRIKEMKTFRCTMFRHRVFICPPPAPEGGFCGILALFTGFCPKYPLYFPCITSVCGHLPRYH